MKVAVVTAGSHGFGRATVLRLARLGADVVIADKDLAAAKKFGEELGANTVVDEVKALGRRCIGVEMDVTDKKAVDSLFGQVLEEFGRVDILVNAHRMVLGANTPSSLYASNATEELLRANVGLNLMATIFCCQAASKPMMKQRSGRIVNIISGTGLRAVRTGVDFHAGGYGPASAGVMNYTWHLASELGAYGINANCIAVDATRTPRMLELDKKGVISFEEIAARSALGRIPEPEDVAKAVEFFTTDLSDSVTAQCLSVCAGIIRFR
jgi:3-oxoacyl-[acyl-carrier protein] reductase